MEADTATWLAYRKWQWIALACRRGRASPTDPISWSQCVLPHTASCCNGCSLCTTEVRSSVSPGKIRAILYMIYGNCLLFTKQCQGLYLPHVLCRSQLYGSMYGGDKSVHNQRAGKALYYKCKCPSTHSPADVSGRHVACSGSDALRQKIGS